MKKMKTLFKKNPNDLSRVIDGEYNEENLWVFDEGVKAYQKHDGTSCAVINGELYKRYDAKGNRRAPEGAIPCCEEDTITGHHPHWVKCDENNPGDKYHWIAWNDLKIKSRFTRREIKDGTYELIGEKIQGNPEDVTGHTLISHKSYEHKDIEAILDNPKEYMRNLDIEGIVFHHPDGRMCKIRKKDFGMSR